MGNNHSSSRVLQIDNVESHLSQCVQLGNKVCSVYGTIHHVRYQSMDFYLGKSTAEQPPSQLYLHYLVPPNLLVIPNFTLLQNVKPETYDELIQLMLGVAKLLKNQEQIYIGRRRLGYANRWGLVGQQSINWPYKQAMRENNTNGVYLSPTLIQQLSHQKLSPIHNPIKSDIFALGIMLVEIIFSQDLSPLFDYVNFQIILKPLLEKLSIVKRQFGQEIYKILISMLQLDEQDRINFNQFYHLIVNLQKRNSYQSSASSSRIKGIVGDLSNINARSPKPNNRSPDRVTSPRQNSRNRSPFQKNLRINSLYKQNRSPRINTKSPISIKRTSTTLLSKR